jgi:hypothetical protein
VSGAVAQWTVVRAPSSGEIMKSLARWRSPQGSSLQMSVATTPGWSAKVVTPLPASRRASSFVKSTLASFDTEYSWKPPAERAGRRCASQSIPLAR